MYLLLTERETIGGHQESPIHHRLHAGVRQAFQYPLPSNGFAHADLRGCWGYPCL